MGYYWVIYAFLEVIGLTLYMARTRHAVKMVRTRQGTSLSRMLYNQN